MVAAAHLKRGIGGQRLRPALVWIHGPPKLHGRSRSALVGRSAPGWREAVGSTMGTPPSSTRRPKRSSYVPGKGWAPLSPGAIVNLCAKRVMTPILETGSDPSFGDSAGCPASFATVSLKKCDRHDPGSGV